MRLARGSLRQGSQSAATRSCAGGWIGAGWMQVSPLSEVDSCLKFGMAKWLFLSPCKLEMHFRWGACMCVKESVKDGCRHGGHNKGTERRANHVMLAQP